MGIVANDKQPEDPNDPDQIPKYKLTPDGTVQQPIVVWLWPIGIAIKILAGVAVSQAARAGGAALSSYIGGMLPQSVKEGAQDLFAQVQNTEAFKTAASAASKGYEFYKDWSSKNPDNAEKFESFIDVQSLFSPRPDMPDIGLPEMVEDTFDYGNQSGISVGKIFGLRKPKYNSDIAGSVQDFGVICLDTAQ